MAIKLKRAYTRVKRSFGFTRSLCAKLPAAYEEVDDLQVNSRHALLPGGTAALYAVLVRYSFFRIAVAHVVAIYQATTSLNMNSQSEQVEVSLQTNQGRTAGDEEIAVSVRVNESIKRSMSL